MREGRLRERLESAVQALQADDLEAAEALLQAVLVDDADQPDALHFLGVLFHRRGDSVAAEALIRRAWAAAPGHAGIHLNLGNVLFETGRVDEAVEAYRRALDLDDGSSQAWHNLGTALHALGDLAQARFAGERAVALNAGNAEAWYGLSRTLIELGEVHPGLLANSRAIALWPHHLQAREQVVRALVMLGELERAEELYRAWLREDPDNPIVVHQLAALGRAPAPARASDGYVEAVFDSFAPLFDGKLAALDYRAPHHLVGALAGLVPVEGTLSIADLGCGTGLCGPGLRPFARRLVGCDLSTGMLVRAAERGCYDSLFKVELTYFLANEPQSYDVAVSADTLCYFGPLAEVCRAAAGALRPAGRFLFTVEALATDEPAFALLPTGRYAHSRSYLAVTLSEAGFTGVGIEAVVLRQEAGLPVQGWLVTAAVPPEGPAPPTGPAGPGPAQAWTATDSGLATTWEEPPGSMVTP